MLAGGVCGSLKGSLGELEGLGDDRVHVAFPARRRVGVSGAQLSPRVISSFPEVPSRGSWDGAIAALHFIHAVFFA
jgi:hypothetical protein